MDVTRMRARVGEILAQYRVPSAAIGILRDGDITDFAVGVKNLSTQEPATTDTIYQVGSQTKAWTALAFMQFVDEGKVRLDEPVRTYLPGFKVADPEVSARVTPRHLLNHTNGIEEAFGNPGEGEDVYERMVENIHGAPQVHALGATHAYSAALGYAILARIMEVVDGKRWDAIMKDRLFDPLGLTSTSSWRMQVDTKRAAAPYMIRSLEEGPIASPMGYLPRCFGPGGNINSTAREVLTMAQVFLGEGKAASGRQIVSAQAIREMQQSRFPLPDPYVLGSEWALGLCVYHWQGETVYAHDGSTGGQQSRLRVLPDSNLAIVMLANAGPRDSLYREIFNLLLSELGAVTIPALPKPDPTLKLDLPRYEGTYKRSDATFEVKADGGKLYLTLIQDPMRARMSLTPERIRYELLPITATNFLVPSNNPLVDTTTLSLSGFKDGAAQYLHTNARMYPRVST